MGDIIKPGSADNGATVIELQASDKQPAKKSLKSKKLLYLVLILLILIAGSATYVIYDNSKSEVLITEAPIQAGVSITSSEVTPGTLSVSAGSQVTWTNDDTTQRQIVADTVEGFDSSIVLEPGESYSFIFEIPGTYLYHDQFNPTEIQGSIEVK